MENERNSLVYFIVGRRKSGKSTYIIQRIEKYMKSLNNIGRDGKVLIIDAQDNEIYRKDNIQTIKPIELIGWKKGIKRIIISDIDDFFKYLAYCKNSFVVIEDSIRFFEANLKRDIKSLIVDTKQIGIDLMFVYHGFMQVPNDIIRLSDFVIIKKTNDVFSECKKKLPFQEVLDGYKEVKESENQYITKIVRIA